MQLIFSACFFLLESIYHFIILKLAKIILNIFKNVFLNGQFAFYWLLTLGATLVWSVEEAHTSC